MTGFVMTALDLLMSAGYATGWVPSLNAVVKTCQKEIVTVTETS